MNANSITGVNVLIFYQALDCRTAAAAFHEDVRVTQHRWSASSRQGKADHRQASGRSPLCARQVSTTGHLRDRDFGVEICEPDAAIEQLDHSHRRAR